MTGSTIEPMLFSECGAEIQPSQLGEDCIPAMYKYHDIIVLGSIQS